MRRRSFAPLFVLATACHYAPLSPSSPASTCYAIEYGAWSRGLYSEPPPVLIALDSAALTDRHWTRGLPLKRLRPNIRQTRPDQPPASWYADSLGVLNLSWGNGYTGYLMSLNTVDAVTLRGRIVGWRDVFTTPPTPDPEASVIARRRECAELGL